MRVTSVRGGQFTPQKLGRPFRFRRVEIYLRYDRDVTLWVGLPEKLDAELKAIVGPLAAAPSNRRLIDSLA